MAELRGYQEFGGDHWELGPLRNALAHQGARVPHTGAAPTEALLLGIAGGITAGYFIFEYEGYPPMFNFLTMNTFDPLSSVLDRLAIETEIQRSGSAAKARQQLLDALSAGKAPLVWADVSSLGYGERERTEDFWFVCPLLVFAYEDGGQARLVDRADVPLTVTAERLDEARARVKKERQKLMTAGDIAEEKLAPAVRAGIEQCLALALDEPPRKPMRGKYGLAAYTRWADELADERSKKGWQRKFAQGSARFALLTSFYHYTHHFGTGGSGARGRYADFLDEAALILDTDDLRAVATEFRAARDGWSALYEAIFSAGEGALRQARSLIDRREALFRERGFESLAERRQLEGELDALRAAADEALALSEADERAWRENMRAAVLELQQQETRAFHALRQAMA